MTRTHGDILIGDEMMKSVHRYLVVIFALFLASKKSSAQELTVVDSVDLQQYVGTWYEIARLPNRFQEECTGNVTATYTILESGEIKVVNRCQKEKDEYSEAEGIAHRASNEEPNSKLKVRFAPSFLSFLPFVWGNYWIIDLAPDYSYAVIGEPNREYLWVLARTPKLEENIFQEILGRVKKQGYDLKELIYTKQLQ
jgi:apolipoprotein D and lipocalin family protein